MRVVSHSNGHWLKDEPPTHVLFEQLAELPPDKRRRSRIRHQLIEIHLPLARFVAHRFSQRGEPCDDLAQVATVGLINSVDRFDVSHGVRFPSYAVPVMVGEVKRHFRDRCWSVRVTRQMQELRIALRQTSANLEQLLGRQPTTGELAAELRVSERDVLAGLQAASAYSTTSLDTPVGTTPFAPTPADSLAAPDDSMSVIENQQALRPLLAELPVRERNILLLRFFGNMTESQIASEVGISQMHVSRLLTRTLSQLRQGLLA